MARRFDLDPASNITNKILDKIDSLLACAGERQADGQQPKVL